MEWRHKGYWCLKHCIVLCCVILCCSVLYCIALYCIVLRCIVLYCTVLYCAVLYRAVLYCIVLCPQEHVLVGWRRKGYWCLQQWPEPVMHQVYQLYMLLVVYLLPLTFMTCTYVSICRRLWQVRYQRASIRAAQ